MTHSEYQQLNYRKLGFEAVYLASCALNDVVPEWDSSEELDNLFRFCKFHSITAIVAMALDSYWKEHPAEPQVMKPWLQARDKAIRKNIMLNAERERILGFLESIGCRYLPLKGSLLQHDYPKFGMRQMSDNDILCDPEKLEQIHEFMLQSGYTCELYNQGNHDEYTRQPVYNFEIHRSLFKPETAPKLAAYYADILERAVKNPDKNYGYRMSRDDFYIYLIAHAHRHFVVSGIGIRNLMDVYVYLNRYGSQLNWAYIENELRELDAWEFERWCNRLSGLLMEIPSRNPAISRSDLEILDAFFASGTFGTEQQLFRNSMKSSGSKVRHFLRRMFPSRELLGVMHPSVRKHGWLVPFVWIYRLVISLIKRPGRVFRELKNILSSEK